MVCKAFRELGHIAFSCDIQDCSGGHPEWHIKGDCLPLLNGRCTFKTCDGTEHTVKGKWDLIIAHPPCTYMSKAGARWMYPKAGQIDEERLEKAMRAKDFFNYIARAECDRICIENPVPLKVVGLPKPTQVVQPYHFGHPFSKATCLWLKGLKPLEPTEILTEFKPFLPSNTGGFSRGQGGSRGVAHNAKEASVTFEGVGKAMASQWGGRETNKEKQIEEMAKQLYGNFGLTMPTARNVSTYLTIKKDYRKASEVARNIFINLRILGHIDFDGNMCIRKDSFEELEKIFTEEK